MMTVEEAVLRLRSDPAHTALIEDNYLGPELRENAERFLRSVEFEEVSRILGGRLASSIVLDVGAGTGIASHALATAGAKKVLSLEPDPSDVVGRGALRRLIRGLPVDVLSAEGEGFPVRDGSIDVVFARQVLHHARNLDLLLRECARVLREGGLFLASREHVVDDDVQLRSFLEAHPVHRLSSSENAWRLDGYLRAMRKAGLRDVQAMGPWDSPLNAHPKVRSREEYFRHPQDALAAILGGWSRRLVHVPGVRRFVSWWLNRRVPGRLYSFLAVKGRTPAPAPRTGAC